MGCDIHIYTEIKRKKDSDVWSHADYFKKSTNRRTGEEEWTRENKILEPIIDRLSFMLSEEMYYSEEHLDRIRIVFWFDN